MRGRSGCDTTLLVLLAIAGPGGRPLPAYLRPPAQVPFEQAVADLTQPGSRQRVCAQSSC